MLGKEGTEISNDIEGKIDSLCDGPCASCDSEEDYFKLNPPSTTLHKNAKTVIIKKAVSQIKEHEEGITLHANTGFTKNSIKLKVWKLN